VRAAAGSALVALTNLVIADQGVIKLRLRHIKPAPNPAAGLWIVVDQRFNILCLRAAALAAA
jgi:hypothetical protein